MDLAAGQRPLAPLVVRNGVQHLQIIVFGEHNQVAANIHAVHIVVYLLCEDPVHTGELIQRHYAGKEQDKGNHRKASTDLAFNALYTALIV